MSDAARRRDYEDSEETPGERRAAIERIRKALSDSEARSGRAAQVTGGPAESLHKRITDRHARLASLLFRIEQTRRFLEGLDDEASAISKEIAGYEKGLRALLGDVLHEAEDREATLWSPIPVLAYRMWRLRDGRLHGVRSAWSGPELEAHCLGGGRVEGRSIGVPHTDGECGKPPCGIYAYGAPQGLIGNLIRPGHAVGLVALSGKVVEHERGYRAQFARVVALAVSDSGVVHYSADPSWVRGVFAGSDPAAPSGGEAGHINVRDHPAADLRRFFETREERFLQQWTSVNPNE